MPQIHATAYQEDIVHLAMVSRVALQPQMQEDLSFIRYIVTKQDVWDVEMYIH